MHFYVSAFVGVGAACGALCRYEIGRIAAEKIAKNQSLKHLAGMSSNATHVMIRCSNNGSKLHANINYL